MILCLVKGKERKKKEEETILLPRNRLAFVFWWLGGVHGQGHLI
jgi:hypothetical protein